MGRFRDFLRQHQTPEEQELLAAKLMGRLRSGAPLVLAPDKDDPTLAADLQRNNDFTYNEMGPHGYAVPLGAHAWRMRGVKQIFLATVQPMPVYEYTPEEATRVSTSVMATRSTGWTRIFLEEDCRGWPPPEQIIPWTSKEK